MENENFVENLATPLGLSASVKTVFGEPITTQGKTIIPVAQVAYGFGGGFGKKHKNYPEKDPHQDEKGAGGGGGVVAKAKGVYEITDQSTRFIPVRNLSQLAFAALVGFLLRGVFMKRSK